MSSRTTRHAVLCLALGLSFACGGSPKRPNEPLINQQLGLRLEAVPSPFQVEANQGRTLKLAVDGKPTQGEVEFVVGAPHPSGVNLVAEVNAKKPEIESQPGGKFLGTLELNTPNGSAFTARGRYDAPSGRMEEIWVLALHPSGDRLLSIVYRYPADEDSSKRMDQMMKVVGEVASSEGRRASSE